MRKIKLFAPKTPKFLAILCGFILLIYGCGFAKQVKTESSNKTAEAQNATIDNNSTKIVSTPISNTNNETKLLNVNLIVNGGAEVSNGDSWTNPEDNLKTFRYDGGWGDAWQVTPPNHGDNYFYAKVSKDLPVAVFSQKVDISKIAQEIDAGKVDYHLDSWYGIRAGAGVRLIAAFYDANEVQIKSSNEDATEKITSANRPSDLEMIEKTHNGQVPAGTRTIKITLEFSLFEVKNDNDGDTALADNLSLILTDKGDK